MISLLFVCLGNICRSPAAEAIMNHLLKENKLDKQVTCDSAGLTTTFLGKPTNETMHSVAIEHGYMINSIARAITPDDFDQADFIFGMTTEITTELQLIAPKESHLKKIHNICEFCEYYPDTDVPDPYGGDREEFEFAIELLEDACKGLFTMVKKQIN